MNIERLYAAYDRRAEESKADLVTRVAEFRDTYGPLHFAELMLGISQRVARDIERERGVA